MRKTDKCEVVGYVSIEKVLKMIGGKWKLRILYMLALEDKLRYGELQRALPPITHKVLSSQLKELEKDEIIIRKEYPMIPPKVEYMLSEKGVGLIPIVEKMCDWIIKYDKRK